MIPFNNIFHVELFVQENKIVLNEKPIIVFVAVQGRVKYATSKLDLRLSKTSLVFLHPSFANTAMFDFQTSYVPANCNLKNFFLT